LNLTVGEDIHIINNILKFSYTLNKGILFGMIDLNNQIIILFTVVAMALFCVFLLRLRSKGYRKVEIPLGLIIGGGISNLCDRVLYQNVVDFIDIGISSRYRWPIFNLADLFVTAGILYLIYSFLSKKFK
jgi:signal peptidase II